MQLLKIFKNDYFLATLAAIFYASWPLGYWLNPSVAHNSLASGLEAIGQPYNWLFVATDIISSVVAILLAVVLWRKYRKNKFSVAIKVCLICLIMFGIGTAVDALIPERCVPGLMVCPSFTQDHILLLHGIFSVTASVFLFIGLYVLWFLKRTSLILDLLIVGYIIFGLVSLFQAIFPGKNGNWSQDYYITLCSIWIIFIPYSLAAIEKEHIRKLAHKQG